MSSHSESCDLNRNLHSVCLVRIALLFFLQTTAGTVGTNAEIMKASLLKLYVYFNKFFSFESDILLFQSYCSCSKFNSNAPSYYSLLAPLGLAGVGRGRPTKAQLRSKTTLASSASWAAADGSVS